MTKPQGLAFSPHPW